MIARTRRRIIALLLGILFLTGCSPARTATPAGTVHAQATEVVLAAGDLGSSRHARVAIPTDKGQLPLTYLARSMPADDLALLRQSAANVQIIVGATREESLALAPQVHGIDGWYCTDEFLQAATQLCWVQAGSAGVDRYLSHRELQDNDRIVFTNMQAVHGPTIADHVFGMLLVLTRDLRYYLDDQHRSTWDRDGSGTERIALRGRTLLVVGLGGIGREVAQRGKGFGMRVVATRRSNTPPPPYVDLQGTPEDLDAFLEQADVIVLCVPLTDETEGMIGARELELLKPGAYLVNIARGRVVDTDALVDALQSGHLAGAGLDVTDPEPLPAGHALWTMPNVIITPHVAGRSALTGERRRVLYFENLRRFGAGEPLMNVVDKGAGY